MKYILQNIPFTLENAFCRIFLSPSECGKLQFHDIFLKLMYQYIKQSIKNL